MNEVEPKQYTWQQRVKYLGSTALILGAGALVGNTVSELDSSVVGALSVVSFSSGVGLITFGCIGEGLAETTGRP